MDESRELNAVIDVIMLAGTILLKSGSEIHRVEDTMIRIAHSQGIMDCNVLAMPAAIFFSIENTNISRMKRAGRLISRQPLKSSKKLVIKPFLIQSSK